MKHTRTEAEKERARAYYKKNRERLIAYNLNYYYTHRDEINAHRRARAKVLREAGKAAAE